jgi:hypothetical protein
MFTISASKGASIQSRDAGELPLGLTKCSHRTQVVISTELIDKREMQ